MSQLRIGFLSSHNYFDRNASSGTPYRMYQALKAQNVQMVNLGNPVKPSLWQKLKKRLLPAKKPPVIGSPRYTAQYRSFAAQVQKQLDRQPCDVIFAPFASKELNFLETDIPIIYCSDITFKLYYRYNPSYYGFNFTPEEVEWKSQEESTAIGKATKLVYPSEWAAKSAIDDYRAGAAKVEIIPYGANIDDPPAFDEVRLKRKLSSPCRLLFIGRNWQRKGGDIAFETLIALHERGIDAELVIVGTVPPAQIEHERLTVIPFLDKNSPEQRQQFRELFWKAHFLIFPTRADFSPISICEANAFGLPVLATDVGGIPTIIQNGKNGYMLPLSASGEDYANLIAEIISDATTYEQLAISSRKEYERRLNWDKWAEKLSQVIINILN